MNIYLTSFFAAIVLIVIGVTVYTHTRAAPAQSPTVASWGGGSLVNPLDNSGTINTAPLPAPDLYSQVQSGPPFYYNPASSGSQTTSNTATYGNSNDNFDLDAFLTELSQPKTTPPAAGTGSTALNNAYAFIPQGLVGTTTSSQTLSASQRALFDYGNSAGLIIQQFENDNANMAQVLKDQFEDPQNPQKISALDTLANALSYTGDRLLTVDPIPAQAATLNAGLSSAYKDMGIKLALVGNAQTDKSRTDAMTTYNKSADGFIKNYVATSLLFSSSGVKFGAGDAGNVFMFTASSL